jgi:hypothetical protein
MKEVFEALANRENGKFKVIDEKHGGPGGSKFFVSHYYLEIEYKGHHILVRFELGNHNMAKIEMQLLPGDTIPDFSITSRSQYYRLFYRKANILKVESVNNAYKVYLEDLLVSTNLEMLARKNLFEPTITLRRESTSKVLLTEFYLGFGDKENVLYGLIVFYKNIIDRL